MATDPYADVKAQVLALLRPLPRSLRSDLDRKVRQTLQEVLATQEPVMRSADRARLAQEITDILAD